MHAQRPHDGDRCRFPPDRENSGSKRCVCAPQYLSAVTSQRPGNCRSQMRDVVMALPFCAGYAGPSLRNGRQDPILLCFRILDLGPLKPLQICAYFPELYPDAPLRLPYDRRTDSLGIVIIPVLIRHLRHRCYASRSAAGIPPKDRRKVLIAL